MRTFKIVQLGLSILALMIAASSLFLNTTWGMLFLILSIALLSISNMIYCFIKIEVELPIQEPPVPVLAKQIRKPIPTMPPEAPKLKFTCKHCQKEFDDEKKLRRHIGMAHYDTLEI